MKKQNKSLVAAIPTMDAEAFVGRFNYCGTEIISETRH